MRACALFQHVEQARSLDSLVSVGRSIAHTLQEQDQAVAYCHMSVQVIIPVELCVQFSLQKTIMINGNQACFAGQCTSVYNVVGAKQS